MENPVPNSDNNNPPQNLEDNISAQGFQKNSSSEPNLRAIRTYKGDVADLVKDRKVSTAKIVLAEQKKRLTEQSNDQQEYTPEEKKKSVKKLVISIVLIFLGLGIIWTTIIFGIIPEQFTSRLPGFKQEERGIIQNSQTVEISATNKTTIEIKNDILRRLSQINNDKLDEVIEFKILFEEFINDENVVSQISSISFLDIIGANPNNKFLRSLNNDFMYAVYTEAEVVPFLILKTNDINISFAEILNWESLMYNDLKDFLKLKEEVPEFIVQEIKATSTSEDGATSTQSISVNVPNPAPKFNKAEFTDIVLSNRDVRAIVDEAGIIIFMYSFIDDENILFTKDINVFQQVIKRISSQQLLR